MRRFVHFSTAGHQPTFTFQDTSIVFYRNNLAQSSATTINYQGRLADKVGAPLNGTYGISFTIYDAPEAGNILWSESHTGVVVTDGLFNVGLGSLTSGGIPTNTWSGDRYLEISVSGEKLNPREVIRSVPIAGLALTVPDAAIGTAQLADGAVTQAKTDKLVAANRPDRVIEVNTGVSTIQPNGEVHIDISGLGFKSIDCVVVSNGDDFAQQNILFGLITWNSNELVMRVWRNGNLVTSGLVRVNYVVLGTK